PSPAARALGLLHLLAAPRHPARLVFLAGPGDGQGIRRHVLVDGRPGGHVAVGSDFHWGDDVHIAAHKSFVADNGLVLAVAVVVDGHGAGADVHVPADAAVADVAVVGNLAAGADGGVLDLGEVAHLDPRRQIRPRPQVAVRTHPAAGPQTAVPHRRLLHPAPVFQVGVFDDRPRADDAVGADDRVAFDYGKGQDDGVHAHCNRIIHVGVGG